jgi:hypothetical protein
MKAILIAVLATCSFASLASADKAFTAEKSATWDCSKDATVTITHGNGKYTFKGACKEITVNGGHNALTIESVATLSVNGSSNTITADNVDTVSLTGSDNKVTYKKSAGTGGKPTVSSLGQNNAVNAGK